MTVEAAFDNNELWQRQQRQLLFISREPRHPRQIWEQAWNIIDVLLAFDQPLSFLILQTESFFGRNIFWTEITEWRGSSDRHLKCSYFQLTDSIHRNLSSLGQIMQRQISNIANGRRPYWTYSSNQMLPFFEKLQYAVLRSLYVDIVVYKYICSVPVPKCTFSH